MLEQSFSNHIGRSLGNSETVSSQNGTDKNRENVPLMPSWSPSAWSHAPKRLKERFWWERRCHGLDELVRRGIAQSFRWLLSPVSPVGTNTCSSHGSSEDQCSYLLSLSSSLREVHVLSTIPEALLKPINLFCTATTRLLSPMPDKKQNKLHSNL